MHPDDPGLPAVIGQPVSRETQQRLAEYAGLLFQWNRSLNLVARSTIPDLWLRHILDSAQLFAHINSQSRSWVDIGAGAGLPGLVIACIAAELRPDLRITLIESDARKSAFLFEVTRRLSLATTVVISRIENAAPQAADIVTARAVAPLPKLLPLVARHLAPDGVALLPKGRTYKAEIDAALVSWSFSYETVASRTSADSVILKIGSISHV